MHWNLPFKHVDVTSIEVLHSNLGRGWSVVLHNVLKIVRHNECGCSNQIPSTLILVESVPPFKPISTLVFVEKLLLIVINIEPHANLFIVCLEHANISLVKIRLLVIAEKN